MTEEKKKLLHQDSKHLVEVYNILFERKEVSFSLHDSQIFNLDSIAKTVHSQYFGVIRFPSYEEQASAYFCLIIKNHPVTDGNKRLAVLWLEVFSRALKLNLKSRITLDILAVAVEKEKTMDLDSIINIVRKALFGK
jgi:hypothetical protein